MESTIYDDEPLDLILNRPRVGLEFIGKHIPEYMPRYETAGSSGLDLRADIEKPMLITPGEVHKMPMGIKLNIPEGMEGQVRSRSGLAWKYGARVVHGVGTIDSDYTGELVMMMETIHPFTVNPGDRIAQIVFAKVEKVILEIEEVNDKGSRGSGGFGSTGI